MLNAKRSNFRCTTVSWVFCRAAHRWSDGSDTVCSSSSWFVDGGFVQVTRDGVYVLTNRLLKPEQIDRKSAEEELQRATEMVATTPQTRSVKERALAQARGKLRISS